MYELIQSCYSLIVRVFKYISLDLNGRRDLLIRVYYHSYIFLWTFYILESFCLGKSKSKFHSYDSFPLGATDKSNNILRSTRCRCQALDSDVTSLSKSNGYGCRIRSRGTALPPGHRPPKPTKGSFRDDTALTLLQKRSQLVC